MFMNIMCASIIMKKLSNFILNNNHNFNKFILPLYIGLILGIGYTESRAPSKKEKINDITLNNYLMEFGYLPKSDIETGNLRTETQFRSAIKNLQHYANIPETGELDEKTKHLLKQPRCGLPDSKETLDFSSDNIDLSDSKKRRRRKRYVVQGAKWDHTDLTWSLVNQTMDEMDVNQVRRMLYNALDVWAKNSKLTFREVLDERADIQVLFARRHHGDGYDFDGPGSVLAHAFYPGTGRGGDAHFDADEVWHTDNKDTDDGTNLMGVAVHEFGHSLGLAHSDVKGSIMFPWYQGYDPDKELPDDDRHGIQYLYGTKQKQWGVVNRPQRPPTTTTTTTTTTMKPIVLYPNKRVPPYNDNEYPHNPNSKNPNYNNNKPTRDREREQREREKWEREQREREKKERDQREREKWEREQWERERERERQQREQWERQQQREKQLREQREKWEREERERQERERQERDREREATKRLYHDNRGHHHNHHHHHGTASPRKPTVTSSNPRLHTTTTLRTPYTTRPHYSPAKPDTCNTDYDAISMYRGELFIFKDKYLWRFKNGEPMEGYPYRIDRIWKFPDNLDFSHVDAVYENKERNIVFFIGKKYYVFDSNNLVKGYPKPLTHLGLPESLEKIDAALVWGHNNKTYFYSGTLYWRFDEDEGKVELDYPRDMSIWAGIGHHISAAFQYSDGKTYFFKGKAYWEFNDSMMRVRHLRPKPSAIIWMRCPNLQEYSSMSDDHQYFIEKNLPLISDGNLTNSTTSNRFNISLKILISLVLGIIISNI